MIEQQAEAASAVPKARRSRGAEDEARSLRAARRRCGGAASPESFEERSGQEQKQELQSTAPARRSDRAAVSSPAKARAPRSFSEAAPCNALERPASWLAAQVLHPAIRSFGRPATRRLSPSTLSLQAGRKEIRLSSMGSRSPSSGRASPSWGHGADGAHRRKSAWSFHQLGAIATGFEIAGTQP